jgi:hypothetical protein
VMDDPSSWRRHNPVSQPSSYSFLAELSWRLLVTNAPRNIHVMESSRVYLV